MSLPMENRLVPSGIKPLPWVARIAVHRLVLCEVQDLHWRHSGVYSGNDMIALAQRGHARPDVDHDARTFVTQNRRKQALRIRARAGKLIRVTYPAGLDLHQDFARFGPVQIHGDDFQGFVGGGGDGGLWSSLMNILSAVERSGRYPKTTRADLEAGYRLPS